MVNSKYVHKKWNFLLEKRNELICSYGEWNIVREITITTTTAQKYEEKNEINR